ncbi:MAG: hypothetical protein EZS28_052969 [Streblomastix strix]|uniref:Ribosomal RNA-processing protein 7 C-terminal domain-containing protein n=1 Tax=Streblomastix strix TaxID=222440 RepID=A0A5J4RMZ2_9EUKA|nr:MAG: hypothetical protein EZS28_052969 [Streblomastix strix]
MVKLCGLQKWLKQWRTRRIDPEALSIEISNEMKKYDEDEKKKIKELQNQQLDSDGFATVVGRKKKRIAYGLATVRQVKEPRIATDFYKFQKADQKKKRMEALAKQFEQDKRSTALLRKSRMFKPF